MFRDPSALTLSGSVLGCDADDVIINSLCTGIFYLVTSVGDVTHLNLDLAVDQTSLTHTAAPTSYIMVQSAMVTDIDVVNHVATIAPGAGTLLPNWANGDLLYQPADWRTIFAGTNMIQSKTFTQTASLWSASFRGNSNGAGQIKTGVYLTGNRVGGGHRYGFHPEYDHEYNVLDFTGQGGQGEAVKNSLFAGSGATFGGHFIDMNGVTAKTALNLVGGIFSVAPIQMYTNQFLCWSLYKSNPDCTGQLIGTVFVDSTGGHTDSAFRLGNSGTPGAALELAQWAGTAVRLISNLNGIGSVQDSQVIYNSYGIDEVSTGFSIVNGTYNISVAGVGGGIAQGNAASGSALSVNKNTGAVTLATSVAAPIVTASTQFVGPGLGLTGTTPSLTAGAATTAASLGAASALPNGTTATTQGASDSSTKVATTAQVQAAIANALTGGGVVAHVASTTYSSTSSLALTTLHHSTGGTLSHLRLCRPHRCGNGNGNMATRRKSNVRWAQRLPEPRGHDSQRNAVGLNQASNGVYPPCAVIYLDSGTAVNYGLTAAGTITTAPTIRYSVSLEYLSQ